MLRLCRRKLLEKSGQISFPGSIPDVLASNMQQGTRYIFYAAVVDPWHLVFAGIDVLGNALGIAIQHC